MMMFKANPSQILSNVKSTLQFQKLTQQKWNRNLSNVKDQRTSKFGLTNKFYQSKRAASFGSEDGEKAIERRILITGCLGQIGTELVALLRRKYGSSNVIASDVRRPEKTDFLAQGPWAYLDVTDPASFHRVIVEYRIDWLIHNSSILSAAGERNPQLAMDINVKGLHNALEAAKTHNLRIFAPSSIAAFGPTTPRDSTPNLTIMRPTTIYGVTKVYLELLGSYYAMKYGVDFRSLRYPGIISAETLPGGGTTDYAVEIYYEALKHGKYTSFLKSDSELPMMYMPDCLKATQKILEVDPELLTDRVYNVTAFSFTPEQLANSIKKYIPDFKIDYKPDFRQKIADSWPKSLDDTLARRDWNWKPDFDLDSMTRDMLIRLKAKLQSQDPNLKLKQIHNV